MSVDIRTTYVVSCTDCGHRNSYTDYTEASEDGSEHRRRHDDMIAIGRRLEGQVFDTNAADVPWYGFVDTAIEAARAQGFAFLSWNGRVIQAAATGNIDRPLCMTADVPGLTP